jgi:hypothetical protein
MGRNSRGERVYRVPVPMGDDFRQIAKIERRSLARQGEVAIEQFVEHWRRALPASDKVTKRDAND